MYCFRCLAFYCGAFASFASSIQVASSDHLSRRSFLQTAAGIASPGVLLGGIANAVGDTIVDENGETSFQVYQVISDATEALSPTLRMVGPTTFLQKLALNNGGAIWLGEHHNSKRDHNLQAKLIRDLHRGQTKLGRPIAIGFEQFQVQYQPVLDEFVRGKLSLDDLKFLCQWDKRWVWPFEGYKEIFTTAQELSIPLVALNVNSEDLALVEQGGLPALPRDKLHDYISDPIGFAQFSSGSDFRAYVDYVIRPSYNLHLKLGLLRNTISGEPMEAPQPFRNFFSGRVLWDETMANRASRWTRENPGGILVGLVGADHVKFCHGIPGRFARLSGGDPSSSVSVLLNPTLIDSRQAGTLLGMQDAENPGSPDSITLQLRYLKEGVDYASTERLLPSSTGGVLPLADYLIIG